MFWQKEITSKTVRKMLVKFNIGGDFYKHVFTATLKNKLECFITEKKMI